MWAWACVNVYDENSFTYGNTFESFLDYCKQFSNPIFYFHNLKYDGEFILSYLFSQGFSWTNKRKLSAKQFTTLISDKGMFYSIKVCYKGTIIEFRDSLKIINMPVADIAKAFGLPESKGEIDYHKYRPPGYVMTPDEVSYIRNDVIIVAKALLYFFNQGLVKMTQGSDALYDFKTHFGNNKNFRKRFPLLPEDIDTFLRKAYKGGFVYVNPAIKGEIQEHGYILDVNSLFPSKLRNYPMPYGEPVHYYGKYEKDDLYPLYVQHISCMFKIKPGKIPTIQIKHTLAFQENEYLESSNFEIVDLYLTSVDLKLFLEHYESSNLVYHEGYKFKAMIHTELVEYIDKWTAVKIQAGKDKNKGLRTIAKLMLNALYGKFGLSITVASKIPYFEDGIVKYKLSEKETRDGVYLPVALFTTAYGRETTITMSQKVREISLQTTNQDLYFYSDTDSIHTGLSKDLILKTFDVDPYEIGKWDIEGEFINGLYIRQKCYLETVLQDDNTYKITPTVAGLPKGMHDLVTYDNFKIGSSFYREEHECTQPGQKTKKRFRHVPGGVVLVDTSFKIKG